MNGERAAGRQSGVASAEAVLVFPVLLLLIMFVIQMALWYHAAGLATAAAQDGARAARAQGATAADGVDRANQLLDQTGPTILQNRRVRATRGVGVTRVEVTARCIELIPFVSLPVHAVTESSTEEFRVRAGR